MTPEQVKDSYQRFVPAAGETVILRRYTGSGANRPFFDVPVKARVTDFRPDELISGSMIQQGDRKVIMEISELIQAQLALPLRRNDQVVVREKELAIVTIDDSTRRVAGQLIAYELHVRG